MLWANEVSVARRYALSVSVGLAPGYLREEFEAVGVRLEDRGQMMDEYTQAMIELWSSPAPSYQGRFVSFSEVDAHPRPWSGSIPKLVFGGGSPATFRRVATMGHGWYGFGMTSMEHVNASRPLTTRLPDTADPITSARSSSS